MKITVKQLKQLIREQVEEARKDSDRYLDWLADELPSAWTNHLKDTEFLERYEEKKESLGYNGDSMHPAIALAMYMQYVKEKQG